MNIRQLFFDFSKLLEGKEDGYLEKIDALIESRNRDGQRFWRVLANYKDFRSGKNLLMIAAAANHIKLSEVLDAHCSIYERDAAGRLCTHYAALGDSVEWMHSFYKRSGEKSVFFARDSAQQRPSDLAEVFLSYRVQKWLMMLQAEEVAKARAAGTEQKIRDILKADGVDPTAFLDYMQSGGLTNETRDF
jgi:hypothetical protein